MNATYDQEQDIILFNNKEILIGGKPIFLNEWFKKGIISIKDLLNDHGNQEGGGDSIVSNYLSSSLAGLNKVE